MFKFRPLISKDFPQMLEWLSRSHVRQWWNDGDDTLEKVALHYGNEDDVSRFILVEESNGVENNIGYFQYYFASDGEIGIDQFIGEENYTNKGVGEKAINIFIELIKREHQPNSIILDPSPDNKRAVRCYEKVGFKHYKTEKNENGEMAYMMRYEI
ncbi:MAG: GNAT family N-acetyltransferase [Pyrinomonadaceae bacterium]|nr:GNAT family N-acetyltransferase [Pyrinomonadaceae bacterium]